MLDDVDETENQVDLSARIRNRQPNRNRISMYWTLREAEHEHQTSQQYFENVQYQKETTLKHTICFILR